MRFRIEVRPLDAGWQALIRCADDAAWPGLPRQIRRTTKGYPHPPLGEPDWWTAETPPLCRATDDDSDLRSTYQRFKNGEPDRKRDDVRAFGRYLFASLLGSDWQAIIGKAGAEVIELELDLAVAGLDFEALPWEMMFCMEGPIMGLRTKGRRVAISRVVASPASSAQMTLEFPLRVLFVVGRQMDNALRPGAEYVGLLRKFETQLAMQNGESLGIALHTKLLLSATRAEVADAIEQFRPSVVHLISHGRQNGADSEIVLTKVEGEAATEDPVRPEQLLNLFKSSGDYVRAVVLNACHTGQPTNAHVAYAAELVKGGIPVAVGMAGQVADSVCRLFTTSFYRALCEELPLPLAVAEGRRAALLQYGRHLDNVEWARPVLYSAGGARTFSVDRSRRDVAVAAGRIRKRKEILCDRLEHLPDLERVCERRILNLSIAVSELGSDGQAIPRVRLGKTWLLEEMAWLSVFENYLPCLVESTDDTDPPRTFLDFALHLARGMNVTRRALELPERHRSAALQLIYAELGRQMPNNDDELDFELGAVIREFSKLGKPSALADTVRRQIGKDLKTFLSDGQAKLQTKGVLILVDDLHRHEGAWQEVLQNVTQHGLGVQDTPAPLIFTYSTQDKAGPLITNFVKGNSARFEMRLLQRFREGPERLMAYRQSLLSRNLVPTADPDLQQQVASLFKRFERLTQGIPSYLRMTKLEDQLEVDVDNSVLLSSDDQEILNAVRRYDGTH